MKYIRIVGESEEDFKKRRHREICANYREANKSKVKESQTKWVSNNSNYFEEHYLKNKGPIKERIRKYKKENSGSVVFWNKSRALKVSQATPKWADTEKIKAIYEAAAELSKSSGTLFHVDHIIPLKGRNVCGLHVHYNLRIIPMDENLKKGNRLLPEDSSHVTYLAKL